MVAVVALVTGFALAGCGNDDEAPDTTPTLSVATSDSSSTTASESASESTSATGPTDSATASSRATPKPSSTSPSAVDLSQPPTTYAAAQAHLKAVGGTAKEIGVFRTSEDVYCALATGPGTPACEAPYGGGVKDPKVCGDAQSDLVGRIELTARGARALCNTDTIRESMPKPVAAPALFTNGASGVQCAVESIGVTCIDPATKAGFFLAKGKYQVF